MAGTPVERVEHQGRQIEALVEELLLVHSAIEPQPEPTPGVVLVGFLDPWEKLAPDGRQLQGRILRELDRYEPLVRVLLRGSSTSAVDEAAEASKEIRDAVDQSSGTYRSTPAEVFDDVRAAFSKHRENLAALYDPAPGEDVYVPDANAIIWNPDLEAWAFVDSDAFELVLTSTLLGELDDLKMRQRPESVREKAERAIRRINEFMRRGDIHDGVTLCGRNRVRMTYAEPDFETTLPWLDPTVKDDRLIASTLEIMRERPHSRTLLVTRDANVKNKARPAGIPIIEPPDAQRTELPQRAPRYDIRILELRATGGSSGVVGFVADVQSRAQHQLRLEFVARVGDELTTCNPSRQDVIVNQMPIQIHITVPRPRLGELIDAFGNENATTLYDQTLTFEVSVDGEPVAAQTWHEHVYSADENSERHAIQQRTWRIGLGEDTEADRRMEHLGGVHNRIEERHQRSWTDP